MTPISGCVECGVHHSRVNPAHLYSSDPRQAVDRTSVPELPRRDKQTAFAVIQPVAISSGLTFDLPTIANGSIRRVFEEATLGLVQIDAVDWFEGRRGFRLRAPPIGRIWIEL